MTYLILFWHGGDGRPAVRVVRGTAEQAAEACEKVKTIYDDENARVVEITDSHDDREQIDADYAYAIGL